MAYVSLHNHTSFSIGDALIKPLKLFEKTKELGQSAVAVTDHGSFAGIWDSYKAAKKTGVKLIVGCEFNFVDDVKEDGPIRHIILIAKNATGYRNLLKLNEEGFDNFRVLFKKAVARVDWKLLEKYKEGVIATTACGNGIISQHIMKGGLEDAKASAKRLKEIYQDNLAIELQPHNLQRRETAYSGAIGQQRINRALKTIAEELGIKCIVATDAHYINKEDHKAHDVLLANASGQPIYSGQRLTYDKAEFYIKSEEEVRAYFERHKSYWGEDFIQSILDNTQYFADQCEDPDWVDPANSTGEKSQLPHFPIEDESDYQDFLKWKQQASSPVFKEGAADDALFYRYRSEKGLEQKISEGKIPEEDRQWCIDQMLEEFDVFEYRGFSSYMLITADFMNWCDKNNVLTGPGRGSCGGSVTAYLNGIHKAYSKRYGLIFARFLNKYKDAYPDVDNDISPSGRAILHDYLRSKYGEKMVAHVSNINTITPKVYARDISRVFEFGDMGRSIAAEIGDDIADSIPEDIKSIKSALDNAPLFAEYAKRYTQLAEFAETICGQPRAWSTHAGGIVIGSREISDVVSVRRDTSGAVVLEYDKESAEDNGLIKIDTLGLETLDIIKETYDLIRMVGKTPPSNHFDYEIEDKKTYDLISEGNTFCVFQLGGAATYLCKEIKPKNIEDIALINALVRPSAKDIVNDVIRVRNGNQPMEIKFDFLERAFKGTYGYGLFEESLMYIAQDAAGWDLHDADKLRKMTKWKGKNPELVEKWKEEFVQGVVKTHGLSEEIGEEIWQNNVESFGGYGFNKCLQCDCNISIHYPTGVFVESKPIKDVQPGEFVRSRDEKTGEDIYIEVIDNHDHGEMEVVEVGLETGEKVKCTMDHKFRTVETGEMLPLHQILKNKLSIVVSNNL